MIRRLLAGMGVLAIMATGVCSSVQRVRAQETETAVPAPRPLHDFLERAWSRMTAEDRAALFDAHLAALHMGLKLTPDQEKLWPPLEAALRESAKLMIDHKQAALSEGPPANPVAGLREMADRLTSTGASLRKIADAASPLYQTLAEDQKRRLPILLHGLRPAHARWMHEPGNPPPEGPPPGWGLPE